MKRLLIHGSPLVLLAFTVVFSGCKGGRQTQDAEVALATSPAAAVEGVLASVSAVADELTTTPVAVRDTAHPGWLQALFLESTAHAQPCARTISLYNPGAGCTSSTLNQNLANCTATNGDVLTGTIALTCENAAGTSPLCTCFTSANSLAAGLSVTRTGEVSRRSARTGLVTTLSSAAHLDYRGEAYGGGVKLTRLPIGNSSTLDIRGIRRTIARGSSTVSDLSIKSTAAIAMGPNLSRPGGRTITGGTVQIANNVDRSLSTVTFNLVEMPAGIVACCHPSSGTATITNGSTTTTVTFAGPPSAACGTVSIATGGQTSQTTLTSCE